MGASRSTRPTRSGCLEPGCQLHRRQEIRFRAPGSRPETEGGHVGVRGRGLEVREKPPGDAETLGLATRSTSGRSLASPLERQLGTDRTGELLSLNKSHELREQELFGAHLEPEGFA
jgi:hypothetical protein